LNGYRTTPSRRGFRIVALTAAIIGVLALAAAAFVLSYTGMRDTVLHAGVTPHLARIYPAIFDAVVVVAGVTALSLPRNRGLLRSYAWLAMLVAIAGVAAADALHATATVLPKRPTELAVAIAPWVLLLIIFTLLFALVRVALPGRKAADQAQPTANGHVAADADPAEATEAEHTSNGTVPLNELLSTRAKPGPDKDAAQTTGAANLTPSGTDKTGTSTVAGTSTIETAQAQTAPADTTVAEGSRTEPAKTEPAKTEPAKGEPAKGGRFRRGKAKRAVEPEPATSDADEPGPDKPVPDDAVPDDASPDATSPGQADSGQADSGQAKADEPSQAAPPDTVPAAASVMTVGAAATAAAATRPGSTEATAPASTTPGTAGTASPSTTPTSTGTAASEATEGITSTGPATATTGVAPETPSFAATSPYSAATTTAEAPLLTPPMRPERDEPSDADAEPAPSFTRLRSTPTPPGD
jgi:hypothetical protein